MGIRGRVWRRRSMSWAENFICQWRQHMFWHHFRQIASTSLRCCQQFVSYHTHTRGSIFYIPPSWQVHSTHSSAVCKSTPRTHEKGRLQGATQEKNWISEVPGSQKRSVWKRDGMSEQLFLFKVKCVMFVNFLEKTATSGGYVLDCYHWSPLRGPSSPQHASDLRWLASTNLKLCPPSSLLVYLRTAAFTPNMKRGFR